MAGLTCYIVFNETDAAIVDKAGIVPRVSRWTIELGSPNHELRRYACSAMASAGVSRELLDDSITLPCCGVDVSAVVHSTTSASSETARKEARVSLPEGSKGAGNRIAYHLTQWSCWCGGGLLWKQPCWS